MIKIEFPEKLGIKHLHWNWFKKRSERKFRNGPNQTYKDYILNNLKDSNNIFITWNEVETLITGDKTAIDAFKTRFGKIKDENLAIAFGYNSFCNSKQYWNAYQLCTFLNIDVCPYCNRQYIFTVGSIKERTVRPELDHFYPKTDYPYLSCSLANFIPSCHTCNHGKREFGEDIIYPYQEGFEDLVRFRASYINSSNIIDNILGRENFAIHLNKNPKYSQGTSNQTEKIDKINASIKTFCLEEIYNKHQIDLRDLFERYCNYSHFKIKEIISLLQKDELLSLENTIHLNENQTDAILDLYAKKMKRMFLGLPLGSGNKQYPLRKFKEDIIEQLDETYKKMKK